MTVVALVGALILIGAAVVVWSIVNRVPGPGYWVDFGWCVAIVAAAFVAAEVAGY